MSRKRRRNENQAGKGGEEGRKEEGRGGVGGRGEEEEVKE